jgi:hypothetical protein
VSGGRISIRLFRRLETLRPGFGADRPDRGDGHDLRTRDHDRRGPRGLASGEGDGGISEAVAAGGGENPAALASDVDTVIDVKRYEGLD